jgi:phage gp36-like protein
VLYSAAHQQSCCSPAATASRCRGNDLDTTIKYLRQIASGAVGIGLGTTIKYPRRATGATAGNGLGTTLSYLRCAAGNGRAQ